MSDDQTLLASKGKKFYAFGSAGALQKTFLSATHMMWWSGQFLFSSGTIALAAVSRHQSWPLAAIHWTSLIPKRIFIHSIQKQDYL